MSRNAALVLLAVLTMSTSGCEADDSSPLPPAPPVDASADHTGASDAQGADRAAGDAGAAVEAGADGASMQDGATEN